MMEKYDSEAFLVTIPVSTWCPICSSDIVIDSPFSRLTLDEDEKQDFGGGGGLVVVIVVVVVVGFVVVVVVVVVVVCNGIVMHPIEHGYVGSEPRIPQKSQEPSTVVILQQIVFGVGWVHL